jgi:hypothetical protein
MKHTLHKSDHEFFSSDSDAIEDVVLAYGEGEPLFGKQLLIVFARFRL